MNTAHAFDVGCAILTELGLWNCLRKRRIGLN